MGEKIFNGRHIANSNEQEFVVFMIGMRINYLFRFWKWVPVFKAMGPMIKELYENPQWGFLHTEFFVSWRKVVLIQYWKSFDDLINYAHGKTHAAAWKAYNQKVKDNGSVLNAISRLINTLLDVGRVIGSSIKRLSTGQKC